MNAIACLRAGLLAAPLALIMAAPASAAPVSVSVDFLDGVGSALSSLTFSYDDSSTGLLGYGDLLSFDLDTGFSVYDLAYVTGTAMSQYFYFGYNADTASFVTSEITGYPQILSAIAANFASGFFYRDDAFATVFRDYRPGSPGEVYYGSVGVETSVAAVPVPAAGLLLLGALGGLAAVRRNKRAA